MIEARSFVSELNTARGILENEGAEFKGEYLLRDKIFSPLDPSKDIDTEFLRLRIYFKNIWPEKDFLVSVKQAVQKEIGVDSVVPVKRGFDSEEEATKFIEENFLDKYKFGFEFTRTGWQYDLGEDQIDLERVEDLPECYVIEFKSPTVDGLRKLKDLLDLKEVIEGHAAFTVRKLLASQKS